MSNFDDVAWNPTERVARKASFLDDYFGKHEYGVRFEGDSRVYRSSEVRIPLDLVLVPQREGDRTDSAPRKSSVESNPTVNNTSKGEER